MKKTFLLVIAAAMLLLGPVLNAQASTDTSCPGEPAIWMPTESGSIDITYTGMSAGDAAFAIFDDMSALNDTDNHFTLAAISSVPGIGSVVADTVAFTQEGDGWTISRMVNGAIDPTTSIAVLEGSDPFFVVAMNNGSGWVAGHDQFQLSYGNHILCWPKSAAMLFQVDAQPVPIPAAVYLLGAGLLGIAGFRKRK